MAHLDIDAVLIRISHAFSAVALEDGVSIAEACVLDNFGLSEQRQAARAADELDDWRRVPDSVIERCGAAMALHDPKGMRFALPAYMSFVLRRYESSDANVLSSLFATLARPDDPRFQLLSETQRDAVRMFLEVMLSVAGGWIDDKLAWRALNRWQNDVE